MTRRILLVLLGAAILAGAAFFGRGLVRDLVIELSKPAVPRESPRPVNVGRTTPAPTATPRVANLAVPFQSQAPRGDWSLPWQEACEEASAVLVDAYWSGEELSVDQMEARILALVDWQQRTLGYYEHTTAADTARILREVFEYRRVDVIDDADIADIADHVRAGRPVIVPLAGRLLGNPYYTGLGPVYHMLVVKGIAENGDIITNDVGTRHGRNFTYASDVFLSAMHDVPTSGAAWPAGVDPAEYIKTGPRRIVVVYPN